mmetsp:Transcript_2356/g.4461  ORF Transcript_2356/g.4461 Transcript_2356/m.4461 type:complete len:234 (+) Transcript_2356:491-1192(+)
MVVLEHLAVFYRVALGAGGDLDHFKLVVLAAYDLDLPPPRLRVPLPMQHQRRLVALPQASLEPPEQPAVFAFRVGYYIRVGKALDFHLTLVFHRVPRGWDKVSVCRGVRNDAIFVARETGVGQHAPNTLEVSRAGQPPMTVVGGYLLTVPLFTLHLALLSVGEERPRHTIPCKPLRQLFRNVTWTIAPGLKARFHVWVLLQPTADFHIRPVLFQESIQIVVDLKGDLVPTVLE